MLCDLFRQAGFVRTTKIVAPVLPNGQPGVGYGFVEYARLASAETALSMFHGYHLFGRPLRLNWAHQGADAGEPIPAWTVQKIGNIPSSSLPTHSLNQEVSITPSRQRSEDRNPSRTDSRLFSVFVGDLAPEINDAALAQAFSIFPSMFDARVIWDLQSHRSRGYGFVRFEEESDAATSITTMQGQWLGSRPIRMNWANRRSEMRPTFVENVSGHENTAQRSSGVQSPSEITAVYVGNLSPNITEEDVASHFAAFGPVVSIQIFQERHFAFVTLETHQGAAQAINHYNSNLLYIQGKQAKVGWARFMRRGAEDETQPAEDIAGRREHQQQVK